MPKNTSETIIKHTITGLKETERLAVATEKLAKSYDRLKGSMGGVSKGGSSIKTTVGGIATATAKADAGAKKFGLTWQGVQRIIIGSLIARSIAQITGALRASIQKAMEFQISIGEIRTIAQDNQRSFGAWAGAVRKLSDEFGNPLIEVAEAHYQTLSNQIAKGTAATQFATEANKLAIVSTSTLDQAVLALSGSLNSYGKSSAYAADESAKLWKMVELGRLRLAEIAPVIGRVTVLGAQMGVTSAEIYAAISTLTIKGMKATEAMSGLRVVFMKMIRPTKKMQEIIESWGVPTAEAAFATFGFVGVLKKLAQFADDAESPIAALATAINRIRGTTAGVGLVTNLEGFQANLDKILNSAESFAKALELMKEVPGYQLRKELTQIANIFTADLGGRAVNSLESMNKLLGGFADRLTNLLTITKHLVGLAATWGLVTAATKASTAANVLWIASGKSLVVTVTALAGAISGRLGAAWAFVAKHPAILAAAAGYALGTMLSKVDQTTGIMKNLSTEYTEKFQWESDKRKLIIDREADAMLEALTAPIDRQIALLHKLTTETDKVLSKYKKDAKDQSQFAKDSFDFAISQAKLDKDSAKQKSLIIARFKNQKFIAGGIDMNTETGVADARAAIAELISLQDMMVSLGKESRTTIKSARTMGAEIDSLRANMRGFIFKDGDARDPRKINELEAQSKAAKKIEESNKRRAKQAVVLKNEQVGLLDTVKGQEQAYKSMAQQLAENVHLITIQRGVNPDGSSGISDQRVRVEALKESYMGLAREFEIAAGSEQTLTDEQTNKLQTRLANLERERLALQAIGAIKVDELFVVRQNVLQSMVAKSQSARADLVLLDIRIKALGTSFNNVSVEVIDAMDAVRAASTLGIGAFGEHTASLGELLERASNSVARIVIANMVAIGEAASRAKGQVNGVSGGAHWTGGMMSRFAGGGSVGSDSIQALLSPGEFVMNKDAARKFLPQLTAMNSGISRLNSGGNVVNNNVGDINVTVQGGDSSESTVRSIASSLRRELRRGTIRLN